MPHVSRPAPLLERLTVALFLGFVVWLPLPLGSNRDWAMGVLVAGTGLLGFLYGLLLWRHPPAAGAASHGAAAAFPLNDAQRAGLPLLACLLASQLWVAVQWWAGLTLDVGQTFQYLMLGLSYCLLFWLALSLFATRERLTLLLWTLVISGTFQAFFGAFMTLSGIEWLFLTPKEFGKGVATGTFVNRNHLAGYLELTLALGIGLLLALRDKRPFAWVHVLETLLGPKARLRLALVIMVIGLVMTHSRGGNTAFMASLLLTGALFAWREKEHRLRNGLILASLLVIDVLIVSQYFGLQKLKERLVNTDVQVTQVDGQVQVDIDDLRDDLLRDAWPLALERPLTGQGAGSFESVFPPYAGPTIIKTAEHLHNDYLQFWIEYGALGLLPLAAFVLLALWRALRPLMSGQGTFRSGVGFGGAMGLLALMIHSASDFNLQIPANAATFVLVGAIAVLAGTHRARHRRPAHPDDSRSR
jgi:O-antigen ligase